MAQTGCTSTEYTIPVSGTTSFTPMHATYVNDKNQSNIKNIEIWQI